MYWISRYLDPWPWPIFHAPVTYTFYVNVPLSLGCMIRKVSAEDIAIRGNGTGLEYMCPTRHFVYIFFKPVFRLSTAKNEINLFNNHVLIVAPVTFAPAGAMTPSAEFLYRFWCPLIVLPASVAQLDACRWSGGCRFDHSLPSADSSRAVVRFWQKNAQVLVKHLEDKTCLGKCG